VPPGLRQYIQHQTFTLEIQVPIESISSPSNQRIKAANSLREARERRDSGLMIIDGDSSARHAFAGGIECTELFLAESNDESHRHLILDWQKLVPEIRINVLSKPAMAKLQYGDREEALIAIARQPSLALETLDERIGEKFGDGKSSCFLVLDQVEKPGNLGAVMRTADAAGVVAVLLSDPVSETWNPNAIRASLGALFRVPMAIGSANQVQRWLTEHSVAMFSARVYADRSYTAVEYPHAVAIAVGNESEGLGDQWNRQEIQAVRIPMHGAIDSLNVSVSTSIVLFEILRQHGRLG
jgi:RNA methyltransferase, TrmH family